jgi:PKD repeat protein
VVNLTVTDNYGLTSASTTESVTVDERPHEGSSEKPGLGQTEQEAIKKQAEAAAAKQHEAEALAAAAKIRQEEAAKLQVLGFQEVSPDVTLAGKPLRANASGAVRIEISCPTGDAKCQGVLTLRTQKAVTSTVGIHKAKPAVLTFGTASFTVAGGKVTTVVLHLSLRARALLEHLHALGVRVTITAHNPAGASHTGQTVTMLLAPKASHSGQ